MSYKDYLKKKKDYSGVLRDSSEREIKVEQTKQAQANRPIGPRQAYTAPKEKESIVDKFHKKYNEIRSNEKAQAVGSVLNKTKKAYIGSNPILSIPFKVMEKGNKTAQNIADITSNSKITGGFVDKGALGNGATGENLYKTVKATGLDVGKQALKGSIVEGGEGLGDLVSVVKDVLSKNKKPSKELERANEEKAEEITNAILAHGKGTARYLNPLNVAKDYYEMFKSKFSGNNDFQEKAKERYEDDKAYFAALEEESALGNEGEAVVSSSAKSARQGFIDTTTGIPWELQMAGEVLPQTYLNERVNKGNSKGKALLHSAVDVGNEIIWENVFDGFNLPRTGKTIDNILDTGINKIGDATTRTALKTGKRVVGEGAEEYGGDITGNALHWAIDNWGQMDGKEYAQGILNTMKETATSDEAIKSGLSGMLSSGLYEVGTGGQYSRQQYQTEKMTQNIIEDQQLTKAQKNTIIEALTEDETKSYKSIKEIQEAIINSKLDHTKKASLAAVLEQQGYKVDNIINDVIEHSNLSEKQRESLNKYLKKEKRSAEEVAMAITLAEARNSIIEDDFIEKYKAEKRENIRNKMLETYKKSDFYNPETSLLNNKLLTENNFDFRNYTMDELSQLVQEKGKAEILEEFDKQKWDVNQKFQRARLENNIDKIVSIQNRYNEIQSEKDKNTKTAEKQPSTMENKPLSESNQQTIQEEGKTAKKATSQETEKKALPKGKKKSKLLNIKSSENITSQEVEQNIKNYLENNEILSEEDLDEKIKAEKDAKELERLQGLKNTITEMRNSVAESNTKEETPEQKQRKSEILETIGKTEEEWNKMSQYGKERTLDNFSLDEITDEDRSLMLEENVVNNEKIEKVEKTEKQNTNSETIETTDKKKLPRKAKLFFDDYTRKDIKRLIEEKGKNELLEDFDKSQNQQMDRTEFENELDKIINKINKDNKKFKMPEDTQTNKVVGKATQNTNDLEEIKKESKKSKNEGDTRVYSHLKLGLESDFVDKEAQKTIAKIIPTPDGRYDVIHNDDKILESEEKISEEGIDEVYNNYIKKFDTGKEMTLDDVYDAEVMIQQYSYKGDSKKVLELLARQAIVVKMAGQKAQAASIMARGTKEGKLFYIEKGLQRYNAEHGENIKINEKLVDKLLKSKTNKEVEKAIDKIYQDIGKQMPATMWDSLDSWRYFSMLFNPSTHLRNIGGNTGMHFLQAFKNNINGIMQDVYKKINPKYEQTVSFVRGNLISKALNREYYKEIRDFTKEDLAEVGDIDSYGSKYSETFKSAVDKYKKTLPPGLDQVSKLNEKALEVEDKLFLDWEYQKSLGRYIAANGWNVENDIRVNKNDSKEVANRKRKNLEKARKWAVKEALEATFHQKSDFATAVTNWEQKVVNSENRRISLAGTVGKVLLDSKLPFKKIPINVLKTAGAYSPVGLLTSTGGMLTDAIGEKRNINKEYNKKLNVLEEKLNTNEISQEIFDRRKNNLDEDRNTKIIDMYNNRFDKIAKGTAGTILAGIGAILSQSGLVRLTGADEDDEDEFNSEIAGEKKYSLVIGDEINIPIDSLAPASVPFLIGANFMQEFKKDTGLDALERAKNAGIISLTSVVDPLVEVSFLQGITSSIKSFAYNDNVPEGLQAFLFGLGLDYINQMVPAIGGKINKVIDPTVRDTSSAQKGAAGQWQRTTNQMLSKINSRLLAPKKDRWGNEISRNNTPFVDASAKVLGDNAFGRGFGRLLDAVSPTNPNYIKQLDKTEKELLDVSGKADKNVLPTQKTIDKKYKVDGKEYVLTDEEFRRSKEIFGKTSKEMLDALVNSKDYKNLKDPKVKAELMNDIYSYAKQVSKEEYFKKHGLKFEVSSTQSVNDMYNTLTEIKKANGKVSDYFDYLVGVKKNELSGKAKKLEYLQKMNLPDRIEKIIYENDVGTYQSISKGADEDYNTLKSITGNKVSNSYLDYVEKNSQGYFKDQKKEGGKGHQQKLEEFLNSSDLSNIERYYIYTMDGNTGYAKYLSKDQRAALRKAIENNQLNISEEKYNDIIKRLDKADNGG